MFQCHSYTEIRIWAYIITLCNPKIYLYIFLRTYLYEFTNLTIPREASSRLTDLYSETLPANCIPDFRLHLKCVHFVDWLCPDSAYNRQTVCTSQPTLWILFGYTFTCFWIQNAVQCFLFSNRIGIIVQETKIFPDFAYVDVCDKWQLIFLKCLTAFENN